jgi:ubiquinone/menaquinone biosynthesis C-methylase UbiE
MDKNDVLEIYNEDYAHKYNRKFIFSDCHADFEQEIINNLLSEICEEVKWLDVACGTGYFLSCFPNVERAGLDISPAMLKIAKQENPGVLFVEGDFRDKHLKWERKNKRVRKNQTCRSKQYK